LEDRTPFLVTEFVSRGSLMGVIRSQQHEFQLKQKYSFCLNAANGMQYLHSRAVPYIHRDLKPQNLLVTTDWTVKIADFGTARLIDAGNIEFNDSDGERNQLAFTTQIGTLPYMAPELMPRGKVTYSTEVDVYRQD